ncbi:MAG TPA: hypothetical protein PL195_12555 [bacterium]|nr:hypothetical protein [bacterium]
MQKALIVNDYRGLDTLNKYLADGWVVVIANPMGGTGGSEKLPHFSSLVIIEKRTD